MMPSVFLANTSNADAPAFLPVGQDCSAKPNQCCYAEGTPKVYGSPQSVNAYPSIFLLLLWLRVG